MDPPVFGRGPSGEVWKLADRLYELLGLCAGILTEAPLFFLLNAYTSGFSPYAALNALKSAMAGAGQGGEASCGEIGLKTTSGGRILPCGIYARHEAIRTAQNQRGS
jgi:23S rRNA (cytosine1962-C5)-methyltransferase